MKKKIIILGSTGSIGKTLINIIKKDISKYEIKLLSANKNVKQLINLAKIFKVKNILISDMRSYVQAKEKYKNLNINIYNNLELFLKKIKGRVDYVMSAISGLDGLEPTINIIPFTKQIAIANKESLICGWPLINKSLNKYKVKFLPVDSEHFSIWHDLKNLKNYKKIEHIYLTASGGPFLNRPLKTFNKINLAEALKHPNWKMGKKISVDSATMINKVYEVIEAKNIFNLSYNKISILVQPSSYVHGIIKYKDGIIKLIAHKTSMSIPVSGTLPGSNNYSTYENNIKLDTLNNLSLAKINKKKYPLIGLLNLIPSKHSLFETVLVSINDELVELFLNKKINFIDISKYMYKFINSDKYKKYMKINVKKIDDIKNLNKKIRVNVRSLFK